MVDHVFRTLEKKLARDLFRLRGQVFAVAVVIASGVAVLVMSLTTLQALRDTSSLFYEKYQFADVFAGLERAPNRLRARLAAIPGIQFVETRITKFASLEVDGFDEPLMGKVVGLPDRGGARLNQPKLVSGRFPSREDGQEAVISKQFSKAHDLAAGDFLQANMGGVQRKLRIVGTAVSPEFVYAIAPGGLMPDEKRFGIIWMGEKSLAAAHDLEGAFNDLSLTLLRGVEPDHVIPHIDRLLARYGGTGAIARKDQVSNWFLMNEIDQLKTVATIMPVIFLLVSGFLTHSVLSRLIAIERSEIGLLKAFGYTDLEVGWHYAKLVLAMTAMGVALGAAIGSWLGRYNTEVYAEIFNLPDLYFNPSSWPYGLSAGLSVGVALFGALGAVRSAVRLPPAVAMRPPEPTSFQRGGFFDVVAGDWFDNSTRIVIRQLSRWPLRSMFSCLGFAFATGILITALQWRDAIETMVEDHFFNSQRQSLVVALRDEKGRSTIEAFRRMPGVLIAEPGRFVGATLSNGQRSHRGSIEGVDGEATLQPIFDLEVGDIRVPEDGIVLSRELAEKLDVLPGDSVTVELLEGRRIKFEAPLVRITDTYIGMNAYMELRRLSRSMMEVPAFGHVMLLVDPQEETALYQELKGLPDVSIVMIRKAMIDKFNETMGETVLVYTTFYVLFSCALVFGVVYNSARIALSERARELATLRVLGYTRSEISHILLGEIGLLVVLALPFGVIAGWGLAELMGEAFATELFRVPTVMMGTTIGLALCITLAAAVASAALVHRRLDELDLISVLKTRE